jgi:hypothetical protein
LQEYQKAAGERAKRQMADAQRELDLVPSLVESFHVL